MGNRGKSLLKITQHKIPHLVFGEGRVEAAERPRDSIIDVPAGHEPLVTDRQPSRHRDF